MMLFLLCHCEHRDAENAIIENHVLFLTYEKDEKEKISDKTGYCASASQKTPHEQQESGLDNDDRRDANKGY